MASPLNSATFAGQLKSELETFRQFVVLLQTEQQALSDGNVDPLTELARLKAEQMAALSRLGNQRSEFLRSLSLSPDRTSMEAWLATLPAAEQPDLRQTWDELLALGTQARDLNEANGAIISAKLRHTQQALAVLQQETGNLTGLYGRDGQTHVPGMGRPLGKV